MAGRILSWPPGFPVPSVYILCNSQTLDGTMSMIDFAPLIRFNIVTKVKTFCGCN